jgi:hypothetical protein
LTWLCVQSELADLSMSFVIKIHIPNPFESVFEFNSMKTMYAGKHIAEGDKIFLFASENSGGSGLVSRGLVRLAVPVPRVATLRRQTPRVTVTVDRSALAQRPLGRDQLKRFRDWNDGRPETELNFKLYRQATDKIVGISDETESFLMGFF